LTQEPRQNTPIPVCDYEGSDYQTRFWENQGREYEDLVERIAIRHMLPPRGTRLVEIGTGFGRLVDLYQGYRHVVLLDYSKSLLRQAQQRLGRDGRYAYAAANIYQLPLVDAVADTVCLVRVIHHLADVPGALRQIHRALRPGGTFLLEYANKRNLKAMLRYAIRRQSWSPYDLDPVEFVELNYDFHPRWMRDQLQEHGLEVQRTRTVSHFRIPLLKRLVPPRFLARLDGLFQGTGELWQLTPSVFLRAVRRDNGHADNPVPDTTDPTLIFCCPSCAQSKWETSETEMHCLSCDARWAIDDGIYDFRQARNKESGQRSVVG
jgi:SAM-dependent methyltransferase